MSLKIIEALFNKMTVVYGNEWTKKWEGMPIEETKGAWAEELKGFSVEQIKHALSNLPERAPNLIQFKDMCRLAPKFFEHQQLTYRPEVPQDKRAKLLEAAGL
jgi:hypothetical protein